MARNGSGTYARTQSDYTFNTVIQETQINSELNDIAAEITNSLDKDGQTSVTGLLKLSVAVNVTANTGSVQGNNPISTMFYEIATCANPGDSCTLPVAVAGQLVIVVNNGAQSADIFPASGDKIDGGSVNVAFALASGANALFICQDGTDWDSLGGGFFTPSSTTTLTNKTFNANGTGNSLSNVDVADLAAGTDGQLITWGADAAPTVVAVGTSGHFLKSQGAGSVPVFAELAISSDASPQLGANLDILAYNITSSSTIMNPSISSTGKALVLGF